MPDNDKLTCPVCRARQNRQARCRRCGADLMLLLKMLDSVDAAEQRYHKAREVGDSELAARNLQYLNWLKPDVARSLAQRFEGPTRYEPPPPLGDDSP